MEVKFNPKNLIPNWGEYFKIIISVLLLVYVFKSLILSSFPEIAQLSDFLQLLIWVFLITYFKNLIDIKWKGRDYF